MPSLRAQYRPIQTTELMRADLGAWCAGKEVTVHMAIVEAGPGATGKHYHPGHSFSWIMEGSEEQTVAGRPPIIAKVGDVIHEEPMLPSENRNTAPVKFLDVQILEKGKPSTTRVQ